MDLSTYSNRDAKIIRDNPDASPYDLLALGLSQKAYDRYTETLEKQSKAPVPRSSTAGKDEDVDDSPAQPSEGIKPAIVETVAAKPNVVKPVLSSAVNNAGDVLSTLTIIGPTGIPQKMNAKQAVKLAARHPNKYKISE